MFDIIRKSIRWGCAELTLETGRIARQADGAVLATYGDTALLCTVVKAKKQMENCDFLPLTVNYLERSYSAGKIPGGFIKRETKPSDYEVLTSRLIDRPIRPLFPDGYHYDTQIVCTLLSYDKLHQPDIPALIGAAAALAVSGLPFQGPLAAARVGVVEGQFVLNPPISAKSDLDLVVAGTESSVLMVESQAHLLSEERMLDAVMFGHAAYRPVIELLRELKEEAGKPAFEFVPSDYSLLQARAEALVGDEIRSAYTVPDKQERRAAVEEAQKKFFAHYQETEGADAPQACASKAFKLAESSAVRRSIVEKRVRIDGRGPADIRPITVETGVLCKTHGSALFTRGETQALVVATLGTDGDAQVVDALHGEYRERFMLNYNFPPYSVGETGPLRAPGRREIGHGRLAWRAIQAVLPPKEDFAYTIRTVSEITESNGSSSMATVCGTSLALMDAGVPVRSPVAGIAMGLVKEGSGFVVLSDILGDEDHLGDMDFKVAGTQDGITALQMDIKVNGVTFEIMRTALEQARQGRLHILSKMAEALDRPREEVSSNAPRIRQIKIDTCKIGAVIGPGGKIIKEICEVSGTSIDIADDGTVSISSTDPANTDKAVAMIRDIVGVPEVGKIYDGVVGKILEFGAVVNFMGNSSGLVHISELAKERVQNVTDYVREGDRVQVKVLSVERGKVRLSIKRAQPGYVDDGSDDAAGGAGGGDYRPRGPRRDHQGPPSGDRYGAPRDAGPSRGGYDDHRGSSSGYGAPRDNREPAPRGRSDRYDDPMSDRYDDRGGFRSGGGPRSGGGGGGRGNDGGRNKHFF